MFEFNKKPPELREQVPPQIKIDTRYIEYLLERICWHNAVGNLEFEKYQELLQDDYTKRGR